MIINDLDLGPSHPWLSPQTGQNTGLTAIEGGRSVLWPRSGIAETQNVQFWVQAWQAIGGQSANTLGAIRYLIRQLEELANTTELQPVYIQWTATAKGSSYNVADYHDGWYVITNLQPDYKSFLISGQVQCRMSVGLVVPGFPSTLGIWWAGGALSTTYSAAAQALIAAPKGSTLMTAPTLSRTGGEGAVPATIPTTFSFDPVQYLRSSTIADTFAGGVRLYDTIDTTVNPVPTSGIVADVDWVQIYGVNHDFVGDLVVTNGLLLLLMRSGQAGFGVYLWNTQLSTAAWQQVGTVNYNDVSFNAGTLRSINLDKVAGAEARVRLFYSTSAGNYCTLKVKLQAGQYFAYVEFWPLSQDNNTSYGLRWSYSAANKIAWNEVALQDIAVTASATLAASTSLGFGASFGQTANGPIAGILYQNAPSASQPIGGVANTDLGLGDATGPAQNSFRLYGFFAIPFLTVPNLQAEAESGTLGTGWTSIADASASAGNTAKCASGTVATNRDIFGTSWIPPAGKYDCWYRVRVTSAAGSAAEMQLGLWDDDGGGGSGAYVTGGSTTYRANQWSTSYTWLKVNPTTPVTPVAGHRMRFRAVTALTLGTDWFIDEAALVPISSATTGVGDFPGDIWSQFGFDRVTSLVRG